MSDIKHWVHPDHIAEIRDMAERGFVKDPGMTVRCLIAEVEMRRDEADKERLLRREHEMSLLKIKETLRRWWRDDRSNWDGSLCGLPTEIERAAVKIAESEARRGDYEHALEMIVRFVATPDDPTEPYLQIAKFAKDTAREALAGEHEEDRS